MTWRSTTHLVTTFFRSAWLPTAWIVSALLVLYLGGCASFQNRPGAAVNLPYSEPVAGSSLSVSIRVLPGSWNGMCDLPDAGNDIRCTFYREMLMRGPGIEFVGGYRGLTFSGAQAVCQDALWSLGTLSYPEILNACARALLEYRWIEDAGVMNEPEVW
jgi:hypothetical protein